MNANVQQFIDTAYEDLKTELPALSEFEVKTLILEKLQEKASEQADLMIQAVQLTVIIKDLSALLRLEP